MEVDITIHMLRINLVLDHVHIMTTRIEVDQDIIHIIEVSFSIIQRIISSTKNFCFEGNHGGQYRGGHRGNGAYHQGNGNNYQKGQYYSNNEQHVRSAPPNTSSGDHQ